ncbi:four-carbon acid sugar kinase family protein [Synoicihabitans lomoniglobus]|uniref:Four-carbon acid sugar kinase family protein n=1 Tax=Synoicihabitans lomoniglobus TaxID=2909285 RepID=A0AAF0CNY5_9BACT|nr:four-carbon acid sugar kinase family protein [Opitutaceae bacterium LMO-M01]WED63094.1 four-carbon acid sugar kinase family protein [Opitutaceae bacterium LMO-M01]
MPTRVVIADDFTGAAEIAGIAHRHGHLVKLHATTTVTPAMDADVLVIDTGNRSRSSAEATSVMRALGRSLAEMQPQPVVFQKIDSLLRGHIGLETSALAHALGKTSVLLLPANPSHQRFIRNGEYFVGITKLHESSLAEGRSDSSVLLPIDQATSVPDVASLEDLRRALYRPLPLTHLAGAADAFTVWLGEPVSAPPPASTKLGPTTIIINGSAAVLAPERDQFAQHGIPVIPPETLCCDGNGPAATYVGAHLKNLLPRILPSPDQHLALTGGATAAAVLRHLGLSCFTVSAEHAPGVVTLLPGTTDHGPVTVKPGSYCWPDSFLDAITRP